ncbi:hypothetical protein ANANG_G00030120 [Anguilla anguilla]|uniref:Uncharacterized protein n=1 Tax=Anguilla anguilla TaxID=7936 RepID=A0A9D3S3T9_ANGAN|nr:hypothetical protein ANANG_G00030120 [Anguilla anguilla]
MLPGLGEEGGVMVGKLVTGVEQRDGKRHGRVCRVTPRTCQAQPAESGAGTACPPRRRKRRRRRLSWKHRETLATLQHPLEDEDWEKEIKEAAPTEDWDKETYDSAYDPEDALCVAMLRTTLNPELRGVHRDLYSPALHHVSPVKWVQLAPQIVADQFIDAEE